MRSVAWRRALWMRRLGPTMVVQNLRQGVGVPQRHIACLREVSTILRSGNTSTHDHREHSSSLYCQLTVRNPVEGVAARLTHAARSPCVCTSEPDGSHSVVQLDGAHWTNPAYEVLLNGGWGDVAGYGENKKDMAGVLDILGPGGCCLGQATAEGAH